MGSSRSIAGMRGRTRSAPSKPAGPPPRRWSSCAPRATPAPAGAGPRRGALCATYLAARARAARCACWCAGAQPPSPGSSRPRRAAGGSCRKITSTGETSRPSVCRARSVRMATACPPRSTRASFTRCVATAWLRETRPSASRRVALVRQPERFVAEALGGEVEPPIGRRSPDDVVGHLDRCAEGEHGAHDGCRDAGFAVRCRRAHPARRG